MTRVRIELPAASIEISQELRDFLDYPVAGLPEYDRETLRGEISTFQQAESNSTREINTLAVCCLMGRLEHATYLWSDLNASLLLRNGVLKRCIESEIDIKVLDALVSAINPYYTWKVMRCVSNWRKMIPLKLDRIELFLGWIERAVVASEHADPLYFTSEQLSKDVADEDLIQFINSSAEKSDLYKKSIVSLLRNAIETANFDLLDSCWETIVGIECCDHFFSVNQSSFWKVIYSDDEAVSRRMIEWVDNHANEDQKSYIYTRYPSNVVKDETPEKIATIISCMDLNKPRALSDIIYKIEKWLEAGNIEQAETAWCFIAEYDHSASAMGKLLLAAARSNDEDIFNIVMSWVARYDGVFEEQLPTIFYSAIGNSHTGILKLLWSYASSEQKHKMLAYKGFCWSDCFVRAVCRQHSADVFDQLFEFATELDISDVISRDNYVLYDMALERGGSAVLDSLWDKATPQQHKDMLAKMDYRNFYKILRRNIFMREGATDNVIWLFERNPEFLLYLHHARDEMKRDGIRNRGGNAFFDGKLYGPANKVIDDWVDQQAAELIARANTGVNVYDAKQGFYLLRSLIHRNEPASIALIKGLLSIEKIKAICHRRFIINQPTGEVSAQLYQFMRVIEPNDLLCLARKNKSVEVEKLLLAVPVISRLDQQTNRCRLFGRCVVKPTVAKVKHKHDGLWMDAGI